ncbi:MAG: MFS transporter [Ancrocorticia sp.]|uniref:MFS transporter n=1 Tax=Ancrocorticia sp. TaxID=2593684 RepID=UPI003F8F7352
MTARPEETVRKDPTPNEITEMVANTPPSGKKRSLGLLAIVACLGSFLFGYDTGVIAGALPFMHMPGEAGGLHLTAFEEGLVGGLLAIGAAIGAIVGGRMSDRWGRRHNITMLAIVFIIGTIGCSVAPNIWVLYPFRIILGFAVGGASATVPVFLAESAPKRLRGPLVAIDQFMIVFGQLVAYSMNAWISTHNGGPQVETTDGHMSWDDAQPIIDSLTITSGNGEAWRLMLVLATIPAVALWIGIRMMPESSRWYAANYHYPEAIGALKRLRDDEKDNVEKEIQQMVEINRQEAEEEKWTLRQAWKTKWTKKILIIGIILGCFDQLTGINTAMYYLPKVLHAVGFGSADAISLNVLTGLAACIGAGVGLWVVATFLRRHVGMYQELGITIALSTLALVFLFGVQPYEQADGTLSSDIPTIVPWLVLVLVAIFVFIKQSGTVVWIYMGELFPAKIRGIGNGLAVGCLWIMNAIVTAVFPPMIENLGGAITYGIFAAINLVAFIFYWKVVPETKIYTLEEIEARLEKKYS